MYSLAVLAASRVGVMMARDGMEDTVGGDDDFSRILMTTYGFYLTDDLW
jgi:hypothetical protein